MKLDFSVVCNNEFLERRTLCVQIFIPFGDNSKSTSQEDGKVICIGSILPSFFVIKFCVNKPQSCTLQVAECCTPSTNTETFEFLL